MDEEGQDAFLNIFVRLKYNVRCTPSHAPNQKKIKRFSGAEPEHAAGRVSNGKTSFLSFASKCIL
jgi:hypothetical protein